MMIRKATVDDIRSIVTIYDEIHDAEERGTMCTGWLRNVYPTERTAMEALERGDLFVCMSENKVCASAVINQMHYVSGQRTTSQSANGDIMVIHTLAVSPSLARKGIGSEFVAFYEDYAREAGCHILQVDTQVKNSVARRFYAKQGFKETDIIDCKPVNEPPLKLVLLEKTVAAKGLI